MLGTTPDTHFATGQQVPRSRSATSAVSIAHLHKMLLAYLPKFAVGTLCTHASGSPMHVLDRGLLHTSGPCVSAACVYASQARFTLPKLGHHMLI